MNPCSWELCWQGRQLFVLALGALVASRAVPLDEGDTDSAVLLLQKSVKLRQANASADAKTRASVLGVGSAHVSAHGSHTVESHQRRTNYSAVTNRHAAKIDCIENTGVSCLFADCSARHGAATCGTGYRCLCQPGFCASAGGTCNKERGERVAPRTKLRNARYPDLFLYVTGWFSGVKLSTDLGDQGDFDIYTLPGQGSQPEDFLLRSVKSPGRVVSVTERYRRSQSQRYKVNIVDSVEIEGGVDGLAVKLVAAPEYEGAPNSTQSVMIESFKFRGNYIYIRGWSSWSEDASVFHGDPGAGGYWIPEPGLPLRLRSYEGPRCLFDCGSYGSGSSSKGNNMKIIIGLAVVGGMLIIMCLFYTQCL